MARPSKYTSEEERRAARLRSRAAYYYRNLDNEREHARARWNRRDETKRNKAPQVSTPKLIPHNTVLVLGESLTIDHGARWADLEGALRRDLDAWRKDTVDDKTELNALTARMMSFRQPSRRRDLLVATIQERQRYASQICGLARQADIVLFNTRLEAYTRNFESLSLDAANIESRLGEILICSREGRDTLTDALDSGQQGATTDQSA